MPWAENSARAAARIRSLVASAFRMGRSFLFSFYHLTNRLARGYDDTNRLVTGFERDESRMKGYGHDRTAVRRLAPGPRATTARRRCAHHGAGLGGADQRLRDLFPGGARRRRSPAAQPPVGRSVLRAA